MSETSNKRETTEVPVVTSFEDWTPATELPPSPAVTLVFVGLVAFAYSRRYSRAEIVFNDGDNRHNLEIRVNGQPAPLPSPVQAISLGIIGKNPSVSFLRRPDSDQDFGHLLDLNGPDFYPNKVPPSPFGIKLVVNHGIFFTEKLTKLAFARFPVPDFPIPPITLSTGSRYGERIGCAIELAMNEQVSLRVNGKELGPFPTSPGVQTTIVFDNECKRDNAPCKHNYLSWRERDRGDFHYHRMILPLTNEVRYGLVLGLGQISPEGRYLVTKGKPQSNDLSPCMGSGYGDSDGLPPDS